MKRIILTTPTPDNTGSRAASTAHSHHATSLAGIGAETSDDDRRDGRINLVPTVDFNYPDEDDEPAPCVRDDWRAAPLLEKCSRQRFACVPSGDVMTMPLLDKRIEVEQLAASTPGLCERHEDMVIVDDVERAKVLVQFPDRVDERTRRVLRIYGFNGCGDGITYWRHCTICRGENIVLDNARHCVGKVVGDAEKLAIGTWQSRARRFDLFLFFFGCRTLAIEFDRRSFVLCNRGEKRAEFRVGGVLLREALDGFEQTLPFRVWLAVG